MYHIAIDIGGTFSDCVVLDASGAVVTIAKSPSTQSDLSEGVLAAVEVAAANLGLSMEELLGQTSLFIHGCTVASNAMVERTGVPTGLVTTRGHEDAILIGRVIQKVAGLSDREVIHQSRLSKADPPIIDHEWIRGVSERVDSRGEVVMPLNRGEAEQAIEELVRQGAQAITISLLWSFLNPEHERWILDLVASRYPGIYACASHEVAPVLGEYERTVTTALNAYIAPRVVGYLERLEKRLREHGFVRDLLLSHCMGGLTTLGEVRSKPLLTLDSGPAGGVLGSRYFGRVGGLPNIICTDMGGTTFDVSLVQHGEPTLDEAPVIAKYGFLLPKMSIHSIGAGGGSVVWVDQDGLLRVGPMSSGADPGPACYGAGGLELTVTDVDVVLGYLNPESFLGGRKRLDKCLAEEALARVAEQLSMDPVAVAAGAFRIVNAQMADLIRQTSIEKGYDPREFVLFAYGGAGPTHAAFYGRELKVRGIIVPRYSTVFSALGMLTGGIVHTAEMSYPVVLPLSPSARDGVASTYATLERRIRDQFARDGIASEVVTIERRAYMKYRLQSHSLPVPVGPGMLDDRAIEEIVEAFERAYAELYGPGSGFRQAGIEMLKCRVDGVSRTVAPRLVEAEPAASADSSAAVKGERPVYFEDAGGFVPTLIYDGGLLRHGQRLIGPCVVERMGDTVVLPPFARGELDAFENLNIRIRTAVEPAATGVAQEVGG